MELGDASWDVDISYALVEERFWPPPRGVGTRRRNLVLG